MQLGLYFDQSRCTGCFTCMVACKDWNDIPAGPAFWIRVATIEQGKFPNVSVNFLAKTCYHCAEPPCVPACPAGAITKLKENNIVVVEQEACLGRAGCGSACLMACPYEAPQFGIDPDSKMEKCNLCLDRWNEGKKPVCVEACPMRALDAGPMEDLEQRYGSRRGETEIVGFTYHNGCKPSILFKEKK